MPLPAGKAAEKTRLSKEPSGSNKTNESNNSIRPQKGLEETCGTFS